MFFGFQDIQFWFYFFIFFPIIFISIYVPGSILVDQLKIKSFTLSFLLANSLGLVIWAFLGYISGFIQIRFAFYIYLILSFIYFLFNINFYKKDLQNLIKLLNTRNAVLITLISIGVLAQISAVFFSGMLYEDGVKFFGNSSVDGVMHLSYIQSISQNFPPQEPGMTQVLIRNYHYWSDMVIADIHRIWQLPITHLFFQFFPFYLSILIGTAGFLLVKEWGGTTKMALYFVFLLYFASDAAYLVLLALQKPLGFYTPAIDSGVMQFLNMPHVFGKLIFLTGLIIFHKWIKERGAWLGFAIVLLFSSLFGFKVYFGIFVAIGLVFYFLNAYFLKIVKKSQKVIKKYDLLIFLLFIIISGLIFLPHNYGAGGFVYVYLEWPRSLLGVGSINWTEWWLRRQVYEADNNIRNLLILDLLSILIAFISIYGTRIIGFLITGRIKNFLGTEKFIFLIPALVIFHLLGLFTIQSSGGVNVFNFFAVSSIILSLLTSYWLSQIKFKGWGIIIVLLFMSLTVPRSINEIFENFTKLKSNDFRLISNDELEAFRFISQSSNQGEIVQAHPDNSLDIETPYVAFFSKRKSYLGGRNLLATHNIRTEDRFGQLQEIFKSTEIVDFKSKLEQKGVSYIYLQNKPEQELKFNLDSNHLQTIFENPSVKILKIN